MFSQLLYASLLRRACTVSDEWRKMTCKNSKHLSADKKRVILMTWSKLNEYLPVIKKNNNNNSYTWNYKTRCFICAHNVLYYLSYKYVYNIIFSYNIRTSNRINAHWFDKLFEYSNIPTRRTDVLLLWFCIIIVTIIIYACHCHRRA